MTTAVRRHHSFTVQTKHCCDTHSCFQLRIHLLPQLDEPTCLVHWQLNVIADTNHINVATNCHFTLRILFSISRAASGASDGIYIRSRNTTAADLQHLHEHLPINRLLIIVHSFSIQKKIKITPKSTPKKSPTIFEMTPVANFEGGRAGSGPSPFWRQTDAVTHGHDS